ncbi:FG-GAP-like repeat-containing protein [Apibacter sp. HY039]|uniref:FG-GAP-like repeat-containing protein n=1 Tax=Apibacter sp. HY039 TaxID=2501476 RepID=UPI000FEC1A16|nr:FG-GAP-like repeat-containing protein [Apibacter sp. HY039]
MKLRIFLAVLLLLQYPTIYSQVLQNDDLKSDESNKLGSEYQNIENKSRDNSSKIDIKNAGIVNFADTKGEISVSNMGSASYVIPVAVPPGVKNIGPQISLSYNSSSDNGIAGYGWSISGISSISVVSTRLDLDGFVSGVSFNENIRFSLDGQRLIVKQGEYGKPGAIYQTENYSNLKIESLGTANLSGKEGVKPEYFKVTFPDGTQVFYGSSEDSRGITEWLIKKWKDPQGNYIEYIYEKEFNTIYISKIFWGKNENKSTGISNCIQFFYKERERSEFAYVQGIKLINTRILDKIEVYSSGALFKKYQVTHEKISGNYQRVSSIQEFNSKNQAANPVTFSYNNTLNSFSEYEKEELESIDGLRNIRLTGDFDGSGLVDVVANNTLYVNIFDTMGKSKIDLSKLEGKLASIPIQSSIDGKFKSKQSFFSLLHEDFTSKSPLHKLKIQLYNLEEGKMVKKSDIKIPFSAANYKYDECRPSSYLPIISEYSVSDDFEYLEGDFNGDGISEIIIINKIWNESSLLYSGRNKIGTFRYPVDGGTGGGTRCDRSGKSYSKHAFYVDLNPEVEQLNQYKLEFLGEKNLVLDFDGDGTSDLLTIRKGGYFEIYSLGKDSKFFKVHSGRISEYDAEKPLLLGDLNGDGKTDIMIPETEGSSHWYVYVSTGEGFVKTKYENFREYKPAWQGPPSANRYRAKQYQLVDLNKDGKADFVESEYESWTVSPEDRDGRGYIRYFENMGGAEKPVFGNMLESVTPRSRYGYEEPIALIVADYKNNEKTGNYLFGQGQQIWKGKFNKDLRKEILITEISESGGNIITKVDYAPLVPNAKNKGLGDATGLYFSSDQEVYPYKEIIQVPNMDVVEKVTVRTGTKYLYQKYKYFGLTAHTQGLGLLGFKKVARSNWMTDENIVKAEIWSVEEMYPQLGRNEGDYSPWISFWTFKGNNYNLIDTPQDNQLLSKRSTRFYTQRSISGIIKILPADKSEKDYITGKTTTENYQYDSYGNPIQTKINNGVSTFTYKYTYDNNATGANENYYIGRLLKKESAVTAYNDTYTSEERFTYDKNLIKQSFKKGYKTDEIAESYTYDDWGNLIQKTISAPGVSPRTVKDTYDSEGRFVIRKTDINNLTENFIYNTWGQVLEHTDALGTKIQTVYDGWGKLIKVTTTGTSDQPLITYTEYQRTSEGGAKIISFNNQTGEYSALYKDVYGRDIKATTKGFASGTYVSKETVYDVLGRKLKESEPYFESEGSPAYWNLTEYDELSRPVKQTLFTGKVNTISYKGLSVTTSDGVKKKTLTKDANGNTIKVDDNGETITYTYYANGTPKTSNYAGHIITTQQDGWGRKTYLHDPAVSTQPYTYSYNNYGEQITETTPDGTTTYTYSPMGKVLTKRITGSHTQVTVSYEYSDKGLLLKETGTANGQAYTNVYNYDTFYRLKNTREITPQAAYFKEFTYDPLGRTQTEKVTTTLGKQVSAITVQNSYNLYNGILDKKTHAESGKILWQLIGMNERMQVLNAQLGNGITIKNTIDGAGFITKTEQKGELSAPLVASYNFEWKRGTLTSRHNQYYNWNERFTYDSFDRLVSWSDPSGVNSNSYAPDGRITSNSQVGEYNYVTSSRYKKSSINLNNAGKSYYEKKSTQQITYNIFKNPVQITEGQEKVIFEYNIHNSRTQAEVSTGNMIHTRKYYSDDKQVEIISDKEGTKIITYISGTPYDAPAIWVTRFTTSGSKSEEGIYYLHRDYQGTILAISNEKGQTIERRLFDPWGKVMKVTDKNGNTQSVNAQFGFMDRGYTGHEHFFTVGLIHMNGRMYDPILKQFLSPDNFIQEAFNSQNYNRYGYVLNNPLMYTDPSGEEFTLAGLAIAAGIGALIGGATYTAYALYTDTFSWSGFVNNVILGGVAGTVSYGIGTLTEMFKTGICSATQTLTATQINIISSGVGASLHAISQGVIVGISGGDVLSGMSSGGISSLVASAVGLGGAAAGINGSKTFGTLFFGTLSGGFGSALTGGNFWQGAATGLVVSGLNHAMHTDSPDNGYEKDENGGYKQINNNGGDSMDYLYENGEVIETRVPFQTGGEVSKNRTYGVLANTGTGGALYDPSWDMFQIYVGFGEIKVGFNLIRMGSTKILKSSVGIRVVLGASKETLKSSVYFEQLIGSRSINIMGIKSLPTLYGKASTWGTFYGRNSLLIGGAMLWHGTNTLYNKTMNLYNKFSF